MPCPECGGLDREPIGYGFWRCTSPRVSVTETGGPGLTDPKAGPGIIRGEHHWVCGAQYQEVLIGTAEELCDCRALAIALCFACKKPVCGVHSGVIGGQRLCLIDLLQFQAILERDRLRDEQERQASADRAWLTWQESARGVLETVQDPTARLVLVVTSCMAPRGRRLSFTSVLGYPVDWPLVRSLIPDPGLARASTDDSPWDHDAVQTWFLNAVRTPPGSISVDEKHRFGMRKRLLPGWTFTEGSTRAVYGHEPAYASISVLADGRRCYGGSLSPLMPDEGFNPHALVQMAERCGLPRLPRLPGSPIPPRYVS